MTSPTETPSLTSLYTISYQEKKTAQYPVFAGKNWSIRNF